jgi:signal transduction histidine kinase
MQAVPTATAHPPAAMLEAELAHRLFAAWTPLSAMGVVGPFAVVQVLRDSPDRALVACWLAVSVLIGVAGLGLAAIRRFAERVSRRALTRAATWISLANGLAVGVLVPLLLDPGSMSGATLPSITCAVAGSATLALHAHRPAMLAMIAGSLAPTLAWLPFSSLPGWPIAFVLLALFAGMLVGHGLSAHRSLRELLILRAENARMLLEAEQRRHAAERAERAKSRFLAAASHDLRQPLQALALEVEAMASQPPASLPPLVQRASRSTRALANLVEGMLEVSRLDVAAVRPALQPVDAARLLGELAAEYGPRARRQGLELRLRVPRSSTLRTDPLLLQRMVRNLLDNALRHTLRGGILLAARPLGEALRIDVFDTGIGIAEEHQARVFEEFYRVPHAAPDSGLGLGLALVRRMADALGATVRLRSRPGRGSTFSLWLPAADGARGDRTSRWPALRRRVLLLDSGLESRLALREVLVAAGLEVVAVEGLDAALRAMVDAASAPDVLLVRIAPPDGDSAIAAIERLRDEFNLPTPAALLCTRADAALADRAQCARIAVFEPPADAGVARRLVGDLLHPADCGPDGGDPSP